MIRVENEERLRGQPVGDGQTRVPLPSRFLRYVIALRHVALQEGVEAWLVERMAGKFYLRLNPERSPVSDASRYVLDFDDEIDAVHFRLWAAGDPDPP